MNLKRLISVLLLLIVISIHFFSYSLKGKIELRFSSEEFLKITHLYLNISSIHIHKAETGDYGWVTLSDKPITLDLASKNLSKIIMVSSLSAGFYDSLRIIIANCSFIYNGTINNLEIQEMDIKVDIDLLVKSNEINTFTIRFIIDENKLITNKSFKIKVISS
ncbi:MAG: DUF4382 domain-containing protein [Candidatus Bathyarchaeia archaeon]